MEAKSVSEFVSDFCVSDADNIGFFLFIRLLKKSLDRIKGLTVYMCVAIQYLKGLQLHDLYMGKNMSKVSCLLILSIPYLLVSNSC